MRTAALRRCVVFGALGLSVLHAPACRRDDPSVTRLDFWTLALSPYFDAYIQDQIVRFEAANPGVDVRWVDVPYEALDRKLIAAAAADRAPDVVNMADLNFARFAALGAFEDLDGRLPEAPAERYLPGALSLCRINGRLLALPWYVNPQARLVNTALLEQGGLTVESLAGDWRGLMSQAREFKRRTGKPLFSQPLGEESQLPIMMLAEGLVPLRETPQGLRADLLRPEVVSYLAEWASLYRDGGLPREAATKGHAHLTEMFQEGRLAVVNTGPNFVKRVRDVAPSVYRTTRVLPGLTGALGRVHMPVMTLSVVAGSDAPREAAALVWHMTSPEAQLEFCRSAAIMPSTADSLRDPFFAPPNPADVPEEERTLLSARSVAAGTLPNAAAFTASLDCWPDLRRAFDDEYRRVLLDGVDVETALRTLTVEWDRILAASEPATLDAVPRPPAVAPEATR